MPRPLHLVLAVLAVLVVLAVLAVAAYVYGRAQCPPPGWWVRLFLDGDDWGCVA